MNQLTELWLQGNKFTGPIPDLSACTEIASLELSDNQFTGVIPHSIVSLPKLVYVTLQNNTLQGPIPDFPNTIMNANIGNSSAGNSFCRDTPGECDSQVSTLLQVAGGLGYPAKLAESWKGNDACNNWTFVNCDASGKVVVVNFAKQGFSGSISPAFANLTSLKDLYLNDNNLTGTIPESLTSITLLKMIDVRNNDLSGKFPNFKPGLILLYLGNSNIGKDVPPPFGSQARSCSSSSELDKRSEGSKVSAGTLASGVITFLAFLAAVMFVSYKCFKKNMKEEREES